MQTGIELIAAERQRQISEKNRSAEHDDTHFAGDLAFAARAYLHEGVARLGHWLNVPRTGAGGPPRDWPFRAGEWHPEEDPIDNFVKAGALAAAEIDRILRERERQQAPTKTPQA